MLLPCCHLTTMSPCYYHDRVFCTRCMCFSEYYVSPKLTRIQDVEVRENSESDGSLQGYTKVCKILLLTAAFFMSETSQNVWARNRRRHRVVRSCRKWRTCTHTRHFPVIRSPAFCLVFTCQVTCTCVRYTRRLPWLIYDVTRFEISMFHAA